MPTFEYKAEGKQGHLVTGTLSAANKEEVDKLLSEKNLKLLTIRKEKKNAFLFRSIKISTRDKISLCRYISLIISSGLSVGEGLDLIASGTSKGSLKRIVEDISSSSRQGKTLHESFGKYRNVFGDSFITVVKTGETSGTLSESFAYLAKTFQQEKELKQKVFNSLMYPIIIVGLMFAVGILVFTFVLPRLASVFTKMDLELPFYTRALFKISLMLQEYMVFVVFGSVAFAVAGVILVKSKGGKKMLGKLAMKTPVVKNVLLDYNLVRFTQSLSSLLKSGVPVTEAVELSTHSLSFVDNKKMAMQFNKKLTKGVPISKAFSEAKLFPPLTIQLITIGEKTGNLEKTLNDLTDFYQDEVENSIKNFITVLEPVLMVIVGIGVGAMVISVISPIYSLISQLQAGL